MTKKKLRKLKFWGLQVAPLFVLYLLACFVGWSFDPEQWPALIGYLWGGCLVSWLLGKYKYVRRLYPSMWVRVPRLSEIEDQFKKLEGYGCKVSVQDADERQPAPRLYVTLHNNVNIYFSEAPATYDEMHHLYAILERYFKAYHKRLNT